MGTATRNIKTVAGATKLGFGASIANAATRIASNAQRAATQIAPAMQASLPVPDPSVKFIGYQPAAPKPKGADIKDLVAQAYGNITKATKGVGNTAVGQGWKNQPGVKAASNLLETLTTDNMGATRKEVGTARGVDIHGKAPDDEVLSQVEENLQHALTDNTWTPQERADIVKQYRDWWSHYTTGGQDQLKAINNFSVQSDFRRLVQQAHAAQEDGKDTPDAMGDWISAYKGPLLSDADDKFGPGFVLSQDEDGWFKIEGIADLQHLIEGNARKDPAFAAQLMARLTAWGVYGGGSDKYVKDRIVFDSHGNPVKAQWTVDDSNGLKTFLADVAKQQEVALNGGELQPWDTILDQVSLQNDTTASTKGYGGGGGGGRGGGYGGGGGGGGGVSYTDADQLKQLINGIARGRLGMALSDADINAFVADYHQKEAAFVRARIAGQDGQQLDPESQAAAWIESRFRDQMGAQQANTYVSGLASFLLGGSFGSTS